MIQAPGMDSHADIANAVAGGVHLLRYERRAVIGVLGYGYQEAII